MSLSLRTFLFGRDDDPYFDPCVYHRFRMSERTLGERFVYRWILPSMWAVQNWKDDWDHKFRNRYQDRWPMTARWQSTHLPDGTWVGRKR